MATNMKARRSLTTREALASSWTPAAAPPPNPCPCARASLGVAVVVLSRRSSSSRMIRQTGARGRGRGMPADVAPAADDAGAEANAPARRRLKRNSTITGSTMPRSPGGTTPPPKAHRGACVCVVKVPMDGAPGRADGRRREYIRTYGYASLDPPGGASRTPRDERTRPSTPTSRGPRIRISARETREQLRRGRRPEDDAVPSGRARKSSPRSPSRDSRTISAFRS